MRQVNVRKRKRNSGSREWITAQQQSEKLTKNKYGICLEDKKLLSYRRETARQLLCMSFKAG